MATMVTGQELDHTAVADRWTGRSGRPTGDTGDGTCGGSSAVDARLAELARAHGVATWYLDGAQRRVTVSPDVVVAVLAQLDVDAYGDAAVRRSLREVRARRGDRRGAPHTITVTQGTAPAVPDGTLDGPDGRRPVHGRLPATLPPGWYSLSHAGGRTDVLVTPGALPAVPPSWGWMVQLYALRSPDSWGIGDLADLRTLVRCSARELGAGLVLCNPLNAPVIGPSVEPSPYSPSSRRFVNPLYLRIAGTDEYRSADAETRRRVDELCPPSGGRIDYDGVWAAKRAALELLWARARGRGPDRDTDSALLDFATYCALAEQHGPDWREWPAGLRHPGQPAVARARTEMADRVGFHAWVQALCRRQLDQVRAEAADAGMPIGVVHDLPVGVDRAGADAWAWQRHLAGEVSVGAPPDAFNPAGQDWGLPPWRPDRLAADAYRPYREVLDAVLRHGDGLRVDHVPGLFRLWWIPPGGSPAPTHDLPTASGMLTGEPVRRRAELGRPVELEQWRAERAELVELLRAEGLVADVGEPGPGGPDGSGPDRSGPDRAGTATSGTDHSGTDTSDLVLAMHALLGRTPCRVRLAAPADVLGEVAQPNMPGTTDEYPNWRLPLSADLPTFMTDDRVRAVAELLGSRAGEEGSTD